MTETLVNTTTVGGQSNSAVTALVDGGHVVTWVSWESDGPSPFNCIYAQRFDASGSPIGGETPVNTYTANMGSPVVAGLSNGDYVVVFVSGGEDGFGHGIYARRFDVSGSPIGGVTRVNTLSDGNKGEPDVAALSDGGYVVTWSFEAFVLVPGLPDQSRYGVYSQRYDASGNPVGSQTLINTTTAEDQQYSAVAALSDGGYVVTWTSNAQGVSGDNIYAQRYDASGNALGNETQVNTFTMGYQRWSDVTALSDGGYVVTWTSAAQDGSGRGIYAQRYDASGNALGNETRVNTFTEGDQDLAAVVQASDGLGGVDTQTIAVTVTDVSS